VGGAVCVRHAKQFVLSVTLCGDWTWIYVRDIDGDGGAFGRRGDQSHFRRYPHSYGELDHDRLSIHWMQAS